MKTHVSNQKVNYSISLLDVCPIFPCPAPPNSFATNLNNAVTSYHLDNSLVFESPVQSGFFGVPEW